jgi:hypothetical protein
VSIPYPSLGDRVGGGAPGVRGGRAREHLLTAIGALIALVLALAVSVEVPSPTIGTVAEVILLALAAVGLLALVVSTRYEVTLAVLAIYLGILDGPIKLETASTAASAGRDVVIAAIAAGMLIRLFLRRQPWTLPPLSGWVLAFAALVVVEALNPYNSNILKVLGGYRQELEFVPFFFFGYLIMRSKRRFRQLFLICGVVALASGLVSGYQSTLSPGQLASWGPGYAEKEQGNGEGLSGRTYVVEGEAHPRPPGLGSDEGGAGSAGLIAIPGLLALLLAGSSRGRPRWPILLCGLGALIGIASSASRTDAVVAVVELVVFASLLLIAGLSVRRMAIGLAVGVVLAVAAGGALVAIQGSEILHRQESLVSPRVKEGRGLELEQEENDDGKTQTLEQIPSDIIHAPFGIGLGVTGAAGGFGGPVKKATIEEQKVAGGSAYNLLLIETGAIGLLLWLGLTGSVIVLAITRLRRIRDPDLRLYLVAMATTFIAFTIAGLSGPTLATSPPGAILWFAPGVLAFWFAGPGRAAMRERSAPTPTSASALPAPGTATA